MIKKDFFRLLARSTTAKSRRDPLVVILPPLRRARPRIVLIVPAQLLVDLVELEELPILLDRSKSFLPNRLQIVVKLANFVQNFASRQSGRASRERSRDHWNAKNVVLKRRIERKSKRVLKQSFRISQNFCASPNWRQLREGVGREFRAIFVEERNGIREINLSALTWLIRLNELREEISVGNFGNFRLFVGTFSD